MGGLRIKSRMERGSIREENGGKAEDLESKGQEKLRKTRRNTAGIMGRRRRRGRRREAHSEILNGFTLPTVYSFPLTYGSQGGRAESERRGKCSGG